MRGLVLGWYDKRNAGDDRLRDCITHWLHDHELTFACHTHVPPTDFIRMHDYVLLGGGSIANVHGGAFRNMGDWIPRSDRPVFCAGLGVSDFEAFRDEFRAVLSSGGRIWVRDRQSQINCRQEADAVSVAPDLSWLMPRRFDMPRKGIALNLRPGGGPRVIDIERWKPVLRGIENCWPWPLAFGRDDDREMLSHVLDQADGIGEFDPTGAARAELVVAMRFHAVIFAIQTGTPFVAITHTKKTNQLLDDLGLGYAAVPYDRPDLFAATRDQVAASMHRADLNRLCDRVSGDAIAFSKRFKLDIEQTAERARRGKGLSSRVREKVRRGMNRWLT